MVESLSKHMKTVSFNFSKFGVGFVLSISIVLRDKVLLKYKQDTLTQGMQSLKGLCPSNAPFGA